MNLTLHFKNINCDPDCSVVINGQVLYAGPVTETINVKYQTLGTVNLSIRFTNKLPGDTVVDTNGTIIKDKNFELEKLVVDDYEFDELIWDSQYRADHGDVYSSCLFFGPPGEFLITFSNPILPWLLKTKHNKYNNDPNWEEDYNYYTQACKLLTQISNK
jgi:hypothetical protein